MYPAMRAAYGEEVLRSLTLPKCVASSTSPEGLKKTLGQVGLYDLLAPHIFSATMVARGKPAPNLFLHAATTMGAPPTECFVIEDSVPGVTAAVAAGMTVAGFVGGSHAYPALADRLRAAGATTVIADVRAIPALLERR
ncbi:MAG: HAD family hydrolase [Alphaproteobacteria bacterium]|nr:HAD family hydrolase [Alphaproteobacteria bacterium]